MYIFHCGMYKNEFFTCILALYFSIMKRNVPVLGFLIGAVMPIIGLYLVSLIFKNGASFGDFFKMLRHSHDQAAKVLSLAILLNILPFIFYTNKRLDLTARGILVATMLYAVLIVLLKFVWN